jgi:hypothetical protein
MVLIKRRSQSLSSSSSHQSINQTILATSQATNQSINQSTYPSLCYSANHSTDELTDQVINLTTKQSRSNDSDNQSERWIPRSEGRCFALKIMGVWQGVAMDSIEFHPGPPCPTLLCRFRGGPRAWRAACCRLLPLWTPHAVGLCSKYLFVNSGAAL